jgi:hypothetical protein
MFPAALPVAIRSTANKLVEMITGKLEKLLAVATGAFLHRRLQIRMHAVHCERMSSHDSEGVSKTNFSSGSRMRDYCIRSNYCAYHPEGASLRLARGVP